jgi:hypothetical protein
MSPAIKKQSQGLVEKVYFSSNVENKRSNPLVLIGYVG